MREIDILEREIRKNTGLWWGWVERFSCKITEIEIEVFGVDRFS